MTADDLDKPVPEGVMLEGRDYVVTRWHDVANYECAYCQYSTIEFWRLELHFEEDGHLWPFPGGGGHPALKK